MTITDVLPEGALNSDAKPADDFDWSSITVEASPGGVPHTGTSRGTGTGRRGRPRKNAKLETLQKKLSSEMFQAGTLTGLALPVTGYYMAQESDNFTTAIVQLASGKPEWLEALEHVADIGPGITVGRTALGIGASFAVDRGRANPEKKAMMFLGVTSAWKAVSGDSTNMREEGSAYTPPPTEFTPVA